MNIEVIFIFFIYQLLQVTSIPFLIGYLILRKIKKKTAFGDFLHRIGFVPKNQKRKKTIWIHAVSVGEILSIQNLIDQILNKSKNNITIYVTTGTVTGKQIAKKNLNTNYISFLPFDFLFSMFIAFKKIKPSSIIIVEAEIWPNFLFLSKFFKIPTFAINARISQRSKNKYLKLKIIFKNLFNTFKQILVQSKQDKINFEKLEIKKEKIKILGNIKTLNVLFKKNKLKQNHVKSQFTILLVGSIHPGESDIYLNLFNKLNSCPNIKNPSNLKLIIAPRHFNWKHTLIKKIENINKKYFLWDNEKTPSNNNVTYTDLTNQIFTNHDILLVCKLGTLFNLYQTCNIFYLGGTFVPIGGHNLLEPAVWSKPSIIGPYYDNCKDITDKLEEKKALFKTNNEKELFDKTIKLLQNSNLTKKMGNNAFNWLKDEANIVQNNLNYLIKELVKF